jgi:hypothetical protein
MDYKLIVRRQSEKFTIFKELYMHDLKVKASEKEDKKIVDESQLILKDKKNNEKILISFPNIDKKDEFLLHVDQF